MKGNESTRRIQQHIRYTGSFVMGLHSKSSNSFGYIPPWLYSEIF